MFSTESRLIYHKPPLSHMSLSLHIYIQYITLSGCEKHGVHSSETNYFVCGTSVNLCLLVHSRHKSSAHFSGQVIKYACPLSSFRLAQRTGRVESWMRKTEKTHLPTGRVHLNLFSCPGYCLAFSGKPQTVAGWNVCRVWSSRRQVQDNLFSCG